MTVSSVLHVTSKSGISQLKLMSIKMNCKCHRIIAINNNYYHCTLRDSSVTLSWSLAQKFYSKRISTPVGNFLILVSVDDQDSLHQSSIIITTNYNYKFPACCSQYTIINNYAQLQFSITCNCFIVSMNCKTWRIKWFIYANNLTFVSAGLLK